MSTKRVQNGRSIDVTLGGTVASGDPLVVGNLVVIASVDGESGDVIACRTTEVHNIAKADAAVMAQGEKVVFDISAGANGEVQDLAFGAGAAGDVVGFGIAWEAAGVTVGEDIAVLLSPGSGDVT